MPGSVAGAVPVAIFPITLSTKFAASRSALLRINEYKDGSTERGVLAIQGRRNWQLSKRLTITELDTLRTFWQAHPNAAFYFYDPYETSPAFTRTPTGATGRHVVRFGSDWQESNGMVRSDVAVELVEVTDTPLGGPANPIVPYRGGIASAVLSIISKRTLNNAIGGSTLWELAFAHGNGAALAVGGGIGPGPNGGVTWDVRTDTYDLPTNTGVGYSGSLGVTVGINTLNSTLTAAVDQLYIYDIRLDVSYGDGSATTYRPVLSQSGLNTTYAYIQNLANAGDNNTATYALIYTDWTHLGHPAPPTLVATFN